MKLWLDNLWKQGLAPGSAGAFGLAFFFFGLATLLRLGLHVISPDVVPFATYFAATLLTAVLAGWQAAIVTALAGGLFSWWAFLPPYFTFSALNIGQLVSFVIYGVSSTAIIWAVRLYGRLIQRLQEEEGYRRMVVEELQHRVKNKLATVYAILNRSLQDNPETWKVVSGRLKALAVTDEFISKMNGQGALLRDILEMELTPYDKSRAILNGPELHLNSKLGTIIALIIHELTTNAAKYGVLSNMTGSLLINWNVDGDRVTVDWREQNGPQVSPPQKRGFGSFLAQRALGPFQGEVKMRFEVGGLECRIAFTLPSA